MSKLVPAAVSTPHSHQSNFGIPETQHKPVEPPPKPEPLTKALTVNDLFRLVFPPEGNSLAPSIGPPQEGGICQPINVQPLLLGRALTARPQFNLRQCADKTEAEYLNRVNHWSTPRNGPRHVSHRSSANDTLKKLAQMALTGKGRVGPRQNKQTFSNKPLQPHEGQLFEGRDGYPLPQVPDVAYSPKKTHKVLTLPPVKDTVATAKKPQQSDPNLRYAANLKDATKKYHSQKHIRTI